VDALAPGDYSVDLAPAPRETGTFTNQDIITAFYRTSEGTWSLFERSGLQLSDLAANRSERYSGPPIESLSGLTDEERDAVMAELAALHAPDTA
jgi:hypothetical protein